MQYFGNRPANDLQPLIETNNPEPTQDQIHRVGYLGQTAILSKKILTVKFDHE